uniref:Uncharacterized protein n=1 Tax=Plasmodium yoelii yoelii TaxID=73239 RepID=Q7RLS3_PLAYO
MFIEGENKSEENYVFIDEKYKEYFDNISDMFEEKVDYILKKHFKKNDPTNKNKLLCLNACVLWRKKFLQLLGKSLTEYDEYCKINEKKKKKDETAKSTKDLNQEKEDEQKYKNGTEKGMNKESENDGETKNVKMDNAEMDSGKIDHDEKVNVKNNGEKDLKSFIKNVKIIDNKNIEVIYDLNENNEDNRPCAELSTDEIYYLLVESKKSENEYKKKIFTFLKYLPLFIKSIENKSIMEKNILEEKLLNNSYEQNEIQNEVDTSNINDNISILEIKNKLDAIISFNCNLSENLETVFNNGIDLINTDKNNSNSANFFQYKYDTLNKNEDNYMNSHKNDNLYGSNNHNNNNGDDNNGDNNGGENNNGDLNNFENMSNKSFNQKTNQSFILPLSKVNDLSLINNINLKSDIGLNDDNNKNDSHFYIYKNNMNKINIYGLDMLINLNNNLIYKINHVYSLIQFYTILTKDIFNDT